MRLSQWLGTASGLGWFLLVVGSLVSRRYGLYGGTKPSGWRRHLWHPQRRPGPRAFFISQLYLTMFAAFCFASVLHLPHHWWLWTAIGVAVGALAALLTANLLDELKRQRRGEVFGGPLPGVGGDPRGPSGGLPSPLGPVPRRR